MDIGYAYHSEDTRTFMDRVWSQLGFGRAHVDAPDEAELEGFCPSYIITEVVAHLDWRDRLRLAIGGTLMIQTLTKTDVVVSRMAAKSKLSILPPKSMEQIP